MASKILLIGATGKYRDSDSYSWNRMETEQPLIGDYENIIIYMPNLTSETFNQVAGAHTALASILKGVNDAMKGNSHVHYIISPPENISGLGMNSYHILPFVITYDVENGKNIIEKSADLPYLQKVAGWQVAFSGEPHNFKTDNLSPVFQRLAQTNHDKNAAFRVIFLKNGGRRGTLDILPPITVSGKPSEEKSISDLIDHYLPLEDIEMDLPERYKAIVLPGEGGLRKEDTLLEQTIKDALDRRVAIKVELGEYDRLKGIVAFKGKPLEKAVDAALKTLGLVYAPTETNKEDGNLSLSEKLSVPVEIKGHETKGSSEKDLRQVIARLKDETADNPVRGILIVNPYYNLSEEEQSGKKAFESSVVEQAKAFHIALLDTRVLMKYVVDQLSGKGNALLGTLSQTAGEVPHHRQSAVANK